MDSVLWLCRRVTAVDQLPCFQNTLMVDMTSRLPILSSSLRLVFPSVPQPFASGLNVSAMGLAGRWARPI